MFAELLIPNTVFIKHNLPFRHDSAPSNSPHHFVLRDVTIVEKNKQKKKTPLGNRQKSKSANFWQLFSPGCACLRVWTTCGMFALRRSAAALRSWRTEFNCFHHIRIPAPVTRFTFTSSQNTSSHKVLTCATKKREINKGGKKRSNIK